MSGRSRSVPRDAPVVLVHGIWMHGLVMRVMSRQLERRGHRTLRVSYDFLGRSPLENAERLGREIRAWVGDETVHLVGHSLGGIVVLHLLHRHPELVVGRVVLLGSPVRGSAVARRVHENRLLRPLLGRSTEGGLLGGAPSDAGGREIGVITGRGRFGLAALVYPSGEEGDGVVAERETLLEDVAERVSVSGSHSSLIFSRECAALVARFLETGSFRAPDRA